MANAVFKVTVTNWSAHNEKVKKGHTHFMISKRIFDDPKVAELRPNEFQLLLYCYSICADMVSEEFQISVGMVPKYFRTGAQLLQNHLERLQELQLLTFEKITPLYNRIEKNIKEKKRKEVPEGPKESAKVVAIELSKKLNSEIWNSYREAYASRYRSEPVRNAKVNSQISQLGKRLGDEAPGIVRFFVEHNKSFYLTKLHDLGLCLADAEALRTQWFHDKAITEKDVKRFADKKDFQDLITDIQENGI